METSFGVVGSKPVASGDRRSQGQGLAGGRTLGTHSARKAPQPQRACKPVVEQDASRFSRKVPERKLHLAEGLDGATQDGGQLPGA